MSIESYQQQKEKMITEHLTGIESPADSFNRYEAAHKLSGFATEDFLRTASSSEYETRYLDEQRAKYRSRAPLLRLLSRDGRDQKEEIKLAKEMKATKMDQLENAKRHHYDEELNTEAAVIAGGLHYHDDEAAYQEEALKDAADSGVEINLEGYQPSKYRKGHRQRGDFVSGIS